MKFNVPERPRVFVPEPIAEIGLNLLRESCECLAPWQDGESLTEEQQREALSDSDAVIVRLFRIRDSDIARSPRLKVIGKHGVGVDNIDCMAATEHGVPVVYTPEANANAVAEHTIGLMLALARNTVAASDALRDGRFGDRSRFMGVELAGRTLGIIGLGRVGRRVAEIASAGLGMEVRAFDPNVTPADYEGRAVLAESIDEILGGCDWISLHVSLNSKTRHLVDAERIGLLKPGCRILNTSRGAVVDESALIAGLESGRIAAAAIDVFEEEPVPADHPLCGAPNLLMTPHISSSTAESMDRMALDSARGVLDVLQGRVPQFPVNPEVFR